MNARIAAVGLPAPDFTLDTTSGKPVTLSSFRGSKNVLLAFYPLAFTGTCTKEMCAFTDEYGAFAEKGVEVLPISVDSTASLKAFKTQLKLGVELVSDFRRKVSESYGVLNEEKFYSNRAYFLVDKEGIVRWSHVEANNSERRENAELLAEIAKLGA